jgi:phage tail protein X
MPLTRRVQVFISQEASDALDVLAEKHGGQTKAIESALLDAFAAAGEFSRLIKKGSDKMAASLDAVSPALDSGRGKASVETFRPLARPRVSIPKPRGKKR